MNQELTTQAAAALLNVSHSYLIKSLADGTIPSITVGTDQRIHLGDLLLFKRYRDNERRQRLAELTQLSQELGLYDE